MANTIVLNEYTAAIKDSPKKYLELGTCGSYGHERISIIQEAGWSCVHRKQLYNCTC